MRPALLSKLRASVAASATCALAWAVAFPAVSYCQQPAGTAAPSSASQESRQEGPARRIPRQLAQTMAALDGTVRERTADGNARPVAGAQIELTSMQTGQTSSVLASGDGVFRFLPLAPGAYGIKVQADNYEPLTIPSLQLNANEVVTLEISLAPIGTTQARSRLPRLPELGPPLAAGATESAGTYREFRHR